MKNKVFFSFLIKFAVTFCICYFGTLALMGLAAPVGHHSVFVENYLDYVKLLRNSLIAGTRFFLNIGGIETYMFNESHIKIVNGRGIIIGNSCVGYGVLSFWTAFVVALKGSFKRKIIWWIAGSVIFWIINVMRLCFLLVATNKGWHFPFGWDHHTWFNIFSYSAMMILIIYYDKKNDQHLEASEIKTNENNN